ncbi:MAG: hypothetical protein ABJB55_09745 [Actinomycetota bacterium]
MRRAIVALIAVALVGIAAPAADATFPARNGWVVFAGLGTSGSKQLFAVRPKPGARILPFLSASAVNDRAPSWGPDGDTLAFVSSRSGLEDIWSVTFGIDPPVDLTNTASLRETLPTWSLDGRIAFVSQGMTGTDTTIDVIDADGSNRATIRSPGRSIFGLEWSPTGGRISYAVPDGDRVDIFSMRADGSQRIRLANDLVHAVIYDWSPDGRWIIFQGGSGSKRGLFAIAPSGAHRIIRLTTASSPGTDGHATYAPNGSRIIFVRDQGSGDELWMMRTDGSGQHRLRKVYRYGVFGIAWQPAGGASS